jgi:serine/threonine protein kinase
MVADDLTQVKIIDFGYATPLQKEALDDASKYLKGKLKCTLNYMAPELYQKSIEFPLDKADIFSLGVILVNFLSGGYSFQSVFESDGSLRKDYQDFVERPH